jgi:hypothetical protein
MFIDPTGAELTGTSAAYADEDDEAQQKEIRRPAMNKNLWITMSSDKRFIENTNRASSQGAYGNWTVFACTDIQEAAAFISDQPEDYFDNLVLGTHGGVASDDPTNKYSPPTNPLFQTNVATGRNLSLYDFRDGKNNTDIGALKIIFSKVRTGGTVVISACDIGGSSTGFGGNDQPSKNMLSKLYVLGGSRFDIFATRGFAKIQAPSVPYIWGFQYNPNPKQFTFPNASLQFHKNKNGYIGYIGGNYKSYIHDIQSSKSPPYISIQPYWCFPRISK